MDGPRRERWPQYRFELLTCGAGDLHRADRDSDEPQLIAAACRDPGSIAPGTAQACRKFYPDARKAKTSPWKSLSGFAALDGQGRLKSRRDKIGGLSLSPPVGPAHKDIDIAAAVASPAGIDRRGEGSSLTANHRDDAVLRELAGLTAWPRPHQRERRRDARPTGRIGRLSPEVPRVPASYQGHWLAVAGEPPCIDIDWPDPRAPRWFPSAFTVLG